MDVAATSPAPPPAPPLPAPPPEPVAPQTVAPSAPLPPRPEPSALHTAWPKSAQLTTVFLLGVAVTLLGVHVWSMLRFGSRPSELERAALAVRPVDLNRAGRPELMQLPGIGPALAGRIDDYRQAHGPFQKVEDLRRVPGIGPKTLERLQPWVYIVTAEDENDLEAPAGQTMPAAGAAMNGRAPGKKETNLTQPIDVNRATAEDLQKLPGIGPTIAQRIMAERTKAPFKSVDDLRRVPGIGPKTLDKLRPHVIASQASANAAG